MLPEINIKESELIHPESKDPIRRENPNQTHLSSCDNDCSNTSDNSHMQEFKFYFIKSTEESKTGFPILPAALNPSHNEPIHPTNSPQQIDSNNKSTFSISKYPECDINSQDQLCISSDANSEYLGLQKCNEMDDMSLFLAIFGLKRKNSQKDDINCNDLKLINAEISNNAETDNTSILCETSGGTDLEINSTCGVEESTNKICPEMNSVSNNLEGVKENSLQIYTEDIDSLCVNIDNIDNSQEKKAETDTFSEKNSEYLDVSTTMNESPSSGDGAQENPMSSSSQDCLCHSERISCQVNPMNETCISVHSSVDVNNFLVDNILRNGSWNVTSCTPGHSSVSVKCETREHISNNHEQEMNNISNHVISSFQGPLPRNSGSQTCTPRHMYSQTGGMNGGFPNFYGSPCLPTPILASQLVSPIFAYNFLPMNNVMCASHPGIMPFPNNGGYVQTSFDCSSQQSVHHSLPLPFHSAQSSPSSIYHKPGFHQWVNVNTSAVVPCWTQSTYIGGTHLPCCGGSSHALEARSQLHFSSGYYPSDGYNSFLTHPFNSDVCVGNDVINVTCRKADDK